MLSGYLKRLRFREDSEIAIDRSNQIPKYLHHSVIHEIAMQEYSLLRIRIQIKQSTSPIISLLEDLFSDNPFQNV